MRRAQATMDRLAPATDLPELDALARQYRPALLAFCYRMLGSQSEAEDIVQETLLRTWHSRPAIDSAAGLRAWVYKVATHACLDALRGHKRRGLVDEKGEPSDPRLPPAQGEDELLWLEPLPDAAHAGGDPESALAAHESVSLAFLAALQRLPPRQRAALILQEVIGWEVGEVAALLGTTPAAVNSALQRARATLRRQPDLEDHDRAKGARDERHHALLRRYVTAWRKLDLTDLVNLLREDAVLAMPPSPSWYRGRRDIRAFLRPWFRAQQAPPLVRPTRANGQPAFAVSFSGPGGPRPLGVQVLTIRGGAIARIDVFLQPRVWSRFTQARQARRAR
ncbi:MAG TPA: RNA polymerase subunit sigma-70 [Myxococcales bacterium]|nr:RNA polymerase subunit sigma-70 [Myxococcales bacterium]